MGVEAGYVHIWDKMSISGDARKSWMSHVPMPGFEDISRDNLQASGTIAYALTNDVTLGARANYSEQEASVPISSVGPYFDWRIWQKGESMLSLSGNFVNNNEGNEGNAFMQYTQRLGNYGVTTSAGQNVGGIDSGTIGNARVWRDTNNPNNNLLLGASLSADKRQKIIAADADWKSNMGQVTGTVQQAYTKNGAALGYGGNFVFGVAQNGFDVQAGGNQNDKSAVIVSVEGDAETDMKIFVNNMERSKVKIGKEQVIYLSPFHIYDIRVSPEKNGLLDYETNSKRVTLYPGNVAKLLWKVNKFYVVTAHIVSENGEPVGDAILKETRQQVVTSGKGYVQAELSAPGKLTFLKQDNSVCSVTLPDNVKPLNGVIIYNDPLLCVSDNAVIEASNELENETVMNLDGEIKTVYP